MEKVSSSNSLVTIANLKTVEGCVWTESVSTTSTAREVFICLYEGCPRMFYSDTALVEHKLCNFRLDMQHLLDRGTAFYTEKIASNV